METVNSATKETSTYKKAGVDLEAGREFVSKLSPLAQSTWRPGVLGQIGGFGAAFELPVDRYKQPVLISGTDGVGTKLKLAIDANLHDGIGIDLVAMCANDVLCTGAEPLYFLDYFATGKLHPQVSQALMKSIVTGCQQANIALIGGETAEMPGLYQSQDYDLAGFCVGVVEKSKLTSPNTIQPGTRLIALASSGFHANGFSLIRYILENQSIDIEQTFNHQTLASTLLEPTKIYVRSVLPLFDDGTVLQAAHITGGGLHENVPRILPKQSKAAICLDSWERPDIFTWLQERGNIPESEMLNTFNCGVGMVLAVSQDKESHALSRLKEAGETAWVIGEVVASDKEGPMVECYHG